eukprot:CAMPEP_0171061844 /NCGR_PEP_ID=MMETSP0766_2-20121228/4705_1 /TAXON_ID=439317 /ORGANISM="Gambierdiscus australes, Strain CAWD 149" /LENGTH=101 /DNA_ID=CAMNT_0011517587 /DNA_START=342 /DNA_END=648 /DNA_ORIENTATION=-
MNAGFPVTSIPPRDFAMRLSAVAALTASSSTPLAATMHKIATAPRCAMRSSANSRCQREKPLADRNDIRKAVVDGEPPNCLYRPHLTMTSLCESSHQPNLP